MVRRTGEGRRAQGNPGHNFKLGLSKYLHYSNSFFEIPKLNSAD